MTDNELTPSPTGVTIDDLWSKLLEMEGRIKSLAAGNIDKPEWAEKEGTETWQQTTRAPRRRLRRTRRGRHSATLSTT